jgi:serpin B
MAVVNTLPLKAQTTNEFSSSLNRFSFDLYSELKVNSENLFISPLSSYFPLLMFYEGANHQTKDEFEKVLYLQRSSDKACFDDLANRLGAYHGLKVFNAIWLENNLHLEEKFKEDVKGKYLSEFRRIEFDKPASAITDINRWVSEKSNNRITRILSSEDINSKTKLLLSNVVYFKEEWLNKFDKKETKTGILFASPENQYEADFMENKESLKYFETKEYQFISKPYIGSVLSFCIILPKDISGIENIESHLNYDLFNKMLDSSYNERIDLIMPKIKLESKFELQNALKKAGLVSAFSNQADFTGITNDTFLMAAYVL